MSEVRVLSEVVLSQVVLSEAHVHLQPWFFPFAATSALAATTLVYIQGWLRIRIVSQKLIPARRLAAFVGGLVLVGMVVGSPLATLDHSSLTLHMVKHLLLMTVAAPLILAGAPDVVLMRGLSPQFIHSEKLFSNGPLRWLGQSGLGQGRLGQRRLGLIITHPVSCWLAGTAAVIGWHLPGAFQWGMRNAWTHNVEDLSFLLAGLLFWWPIVQSSPQASSSTTRKFSAWPMAFYLFLATIPCDILSAFLVFCNRLVYRCYLSSTPLFGFSPLQDQECAGALMWVWVTFAYLIPSVYITLKILSPSNRDVMPPQGAWPASAIRLNDARSKNCGISAYALSSYSRETVGYYSDSRNHLSFRPGSDDPSVRIRRSPPPGMNDTAMHSSASDLAKKLPWELEAEAAASDTS